MLKPIGNRVLLKQLTKETITSSGIIIPDVAQVNPNIGLVVAISDKVAKTGQISVNNYVSYFPSTGVNIVVDNEDYTLVYDIDILTILK